jgi:hypothetical protein
LHSYPLFAIHMKSTSYCFLHILHWLVALFWSSKSLLSLWKIHHGWQESKITPDVGNGWSRIMWDKEARSGWGLTSLGRNLHRRSKIKSVNFLAWMHFGQKTADLFAAKRWRLNSVTKKKATLWHSLIVVTCRNVLQFLKMLPLKCKTCCTKLVSERWMAWVLFVRGSVLVQLVNLKRT